VLLDAIGDLDILRILANPMQEAPFPGRIPPFPAILRVPAQESYLALVGTVVTWFGLRTGLSREQCHELEVAVDEVCTNVIRHAFPDEARGEMCIVCSPLPNGLEVKVQDDGEPLDKERGIEIAEQKRAEDPASGGLGLLLIHQLTDAAEYHHDEQAGNQYTLIKYT